MLLSIATQVFACYSALICPGVQSVVEECKLRLHYTMHDKPSAYIYKAHNRKLAIGRHGRWQVDQEEKQAEIMAAAVTKLKAGVQPGDVETDLMLEEVPSGQ